MLPLLLKGLQRYCPTNRELFWDVKMKTGAFEKKLKHKNWNNYAFCNGTIDRKYINILLLSSTSKLCTSIFDVKNS